MIPGGDTEIEQTPAPRSSLFSNTRVLVAGRFISAVFAFGGTWLIIRTLSKEEFGHYAFVFSLLAIVSIVADLGLGRIAVSGVVDESPEADRGRFAANYILLRTSLSLIASAIALGYVWITDQSSEVRLATLIGCFVVVIATPAGAYDVAYQAHDRMAPVARAGFISQILTTAFVVALVFAGGSWVWFVVPAVFREVVELSLKVGEAHRLVPFRYQLDLKLWWPMLAEAVPLSIGTALAMVYYRVDSLMLEAIQGPEAVGTYSVMYKFADLLHIVPWALTTSLLASLVRAWPEKPEVFQTLVRQSGQLLMLLSGLVISGFIVFGPAAIDFLYGDEYMEGVNVARVLVTSTGFTFFTLLAFTGLVAAGRHAVYPFITLAGLVVNVVLNLIIIPRWSFDGAGATTLVTEAVVATLLWMQLLRIPGIRPLGTLNVFPIALAGVVGGAAGWGAMQLIPWPIATLVTTGVFVGVATLAGVGGERGIKGLVGEALTA